MFAWVEAAGCSAEFKWMVMNGCDKRKHLLLLH